MSGDGDDSHDTGDDGDCGDAGTCKMILTNVVLMLTMMMNMYDDG